MNSLCSAEIVETDEASYDKVSSGAILLAEEAEVRDVSSGAVVVATKVTGLQKVSSGAAVICNNAVSLRQGVDISSGGGLYSTVAEYEWSLKDKRLDILTHGYGQETLKYIEEDLEIAELLDEYRR